MPQTSPDSEWPDPEWRIASAAVSYLDALAEMDARAAAIRADGAPELIWLLEHPPLYTAGTSARSQDLLSPERFPVFQTGRGGQYAYHGPGQRVGYVMLDLQRRASDVRAYVHALEDWLIRTLARFDVCGERRDDRVGIWVARPGNGRREDKIAAIGVRIRKWVTSHGFALNVNPNLEHFQGIVPCGIRAHGITSLADLGVSASPSQIDDALRAAFDEVFGRTADSPMRPQY